MKLKTTNKGDARGELQGKCSDNAPTKNWPIAQQGEIISMKSPVGRQNPEGSTL